MAIFTIKDEGVRKVPPVKIGLERDIQRLFEKIADLTRKGSLVRSQAHPLREVLTFEEISLRIALA